VAGANFALGWTRKWHPRLNFIFMSLGLPPGGALITSQDFNKIWNKKKCFVFID
jgi:hypothetical protein